MRQATQEVKFPPPDFTEVCPKRQNESNNEPLCMGEQCVLQNV